MKRTILAFLILLFAIMLPSCGGGSNPVQQTGQSANPGDAAQSQTALSHGTQLWGLWEVEWNPSSNQFESIPMRSAMFACNVIKFINSSPYNFTIKVNSIQHPTGYIDFDLDIGIRHPFPGLNIYTGFDVMGVFMGQGSIQYPGPEGFAIAGPDDQQLLNPDGYTRRFNAPEFASAGQIMPLQGYFPGRKGWSDYLPTAVLNPYKYYADGKDTETDAFAFLEQNPESRGAFRPGSVNTANFLVRMPNSNLKFQYAVLANWEPNINHPNPPASIDDFPISANSQEAVAISVVDLSDAYFVNQTTYGGDIALNITPWDWSATTSDVMAEYSIKLYSTAWTGPYDVFMTPSAQGDHQYTFNAKVPAATLNASGSLPIWIEIDYPAFDYTSPVGVPNNATGQLAAYFKTEVNILDHSPTNINDNFIYGFSDSQFFDYATMPDNDKLFTNMLNLPLTGPYAQNKKVMYYEGHTTGWIEYTSFTQLVQSLGYESVYVPPFPYTPLDTTGVKMLVLTTWHSIDGEVYTPDEIKAIKDLIQGGGICIICVENVTCFVPPEGFGTLLLDQLQTELKLDFKGDSYVQFDSYPYADFTPDPITAGLTAINGNWSGEFEVFGDAVSLVRGTDSNSGIPYTAICKSPWRG